jgi:large subunit ribosomal protein L10
MATQALVSCSCTSVSAKEQLGSAFWGAPSSSSNNPIISGSGYDDAQVRCFRRRARAPLPGVRMAISRKKKEETVDRAKQQLEGAYLVAGIKYAGLTVKQFQQLRKSLPQDTTLMVAKNKLIGKAIEGTRWEALKPALTGMNAWLFVHTEEIPAALKPYRTLQKELKLENNDFSGAVFEGRFYSPEEFKALETMPTRADLYSKLLGTLKSPSSNLVGTLQGPARNLVFTLKAYVKKLEEEA